MEDGSAGPRLGAAAEAAEALAQPGGTLRPFAQFSGAAGPDEGGGDWSFIDCEMMEEVDLQDLPSATIACHLDPRVFVDGLCRARSVVGQRNLPPVSSTPSHSLRECALSPVTFGSRKELTLMNPDKAVTSLRLFPPRIHRQITIFFLSSFCNFFSFFFFFFFFFTTEWHAGS
ncbi:hypothetical protein G4228_018050 [Cervus hanglu yarkandensis]|nr:hypothetical protein G4228_018050 [Cervus hanglu yarkandensis]